MLFCRQCANRHAAFEANKQDICVPNDETALNAMLRRYNSMQNLVETDWGRARERRGRWAVVDVPPSRALDRRLPVAHTHRLLRGKKRR